MSAANRLVLAALLRAPARTALRVAVLAAAVALLGSMLLFVGHSLRTITGAAVRAVPLDWQAPVTSAARAQQLAGAVSRQPGILAAQAAATAPFAGASHTSTAGTTSAGSGAILALTPTQPNAIHTYRFLRGSLRPGSIVLDQQLAATLQAGVGDTVELLARSGGRPQRLTVSGVALITAPDVVFQPLNPVLGPAPAQPPANAALMDLATFTRTVAPQFSAPASPTAEGTTPSGAQNTVQWQVQAQVRPGAVSGTPAHAFAQAGQIRRRIERTLTGQVRFVDNLSEHLETATSDALYAETLYIMLAVPGALIALGLAYLAALGTVERDRRDLALLRARGASRRALIWVAALESLILGLLGGVLGAAVAFAAVSLIVPEGIVLSPTAAITTVIACVVLAGAGAASARIGTSRSAWTDPAGDANRGSRRPARPLWQRLYLDLLALALSGAIYWLTVSTGFSAVVNPDSNPTLSLSVYMFFAPALLWLGTTLLLVRLRGRLFSSLARGVAARGADRTLSFVLASAGRRGAAINRGLLVVGLLLAFGVNLGVFTATYDQQARVDAQLTLGADVAVTTSPTAAAKHLPRRIAALAGVQATSTVEHTYAYVGPDLQDTFGVDPESIGRATALRDSYFLGSSAKQAIQRLRRPDAILVSKETITDYALKLGDLLNLRILDHRSGRFRVVAFHVAGIVQEFPSAPRDSFMVANAAYLQSVTHAAGPNLIFAKAADPAAAARRIAAATRAAGTSVKSIAEQGPQTSSAITTVDLRGISQIEEVFTVLLAAAAMALFFGLEVIERRHEFATMAALGATMSRIGAFVWSEVALVLIASLLLAGVLGTLLAMMLVAMLQHVFDPPPDHLAIPWRYLAELGGAAVLATAVAGVIASLQLRRLRLGELLREQ